jgi:hypothetical protein
MKQLCGFDITERAQTELQRKGAAFELVSQEKQAKSHFGLNGRLAQSSSSPPRRSIRISRK